MNIILFKWPPSPGIDAANPRGVSVNRILAYLKVDYSARIVNPNKANLDPLKLGKWISGFPIVSINGEAVNGIYRILKTLSSNLHSYSALKLWETYPQTSDLSSWAFDHLYFLALYARLKRRDNYFKYAEAIAKSQGDPEAVHTVALMRELFLESLKWSSIGDLSENEFRDVLLCALGSLEQRLKHKGPYLVNSDICIADFAVFGPIQVLLAPEMGGVPRLVETLG
jgi:hypothetical protein